MTLRPGPRNLITDVPGLCVGHASSEPAQTGVTALVCDGLWTAAADVRGGGPGLREIEVMAPENSVRGINAIALSGGSVFGLGAADGMVNELAARGIGLTVRTGELVVPIVPGAVLYDLNNAGDKDWGDEPPYRALGRMAVAAALDNGPGALFALGSVGAGRGAMAGTVKGGLGSASLDLGEGLVVGALVAVNPVGSVFLPDGRTFLAWPYEIDGEFGGIRPTADLAPAIAPFPDQSRLSAAGRAQPGSATTLAVIACNARLDKAEAKRLAMMAQDGLARAIRPIHTPFDGDVVFALASGEVELTAQPDRNWQLARLGAAAADCLARAIARGVYHAAASVAAPASD
ncbi:P1 family peptidase [Novosphingobium sp.]|uniref:P1 family peptidase n=1 Tax=Novosphingobium sp. TaxID=1874826 RepID=UPI0038BCDCFA